MSVELYPYQGEAVEALDRVTEDNTLLCLPTGSGKTITAVKWLREKYLKNGKRVLWLVHRIELVDQAAATFQMLCPDVKTTRWTADEKDGSGRAVVGMIFSSRGLKGRFDCIVIDESHHAAMPSYMDKLRSGDLEYDFLLGLTATPTRLDKKKLPYTNIAYQTTVIELARQGYLAWPDYVCVRTNQKYHMRMQAGDFSGKSLRRLDNYARNKLVVDEYRRGDYGTTLIFAVNVRHAVAICKMLQRDGVQAEVVYAESPEEHRTAAVEKMRAGKLDVVVNVQLFTEGVDLPGVNTIFLARPTASEVLWCQMVGRGTRTNRPCPGCGQKVRAAKSTDSSCPEDYQCPSCGWAGPSREGWKERFRVVDFVDDVAKYASLAADWALDHLGAEKEEKPEQEALGQALVGAMKEIGMRPPKKDEIERVLLDVQGVLMYSNKYKKNEKMLVTVEQYRSFLKMQSMFGKLAGSSNFTGALTSVYGLCCPAGELTLTQWKSIGWSMLLKSRGIDKAENGGKTYKWIPVRAEDPAKEGVEEELQRTRKEMRRRETLFKPVVMAEVTDKVKKQIAEILPDWVGIIEHAEFADSVIRVYVNMSFERMNAQVYNFIRETYQEVTDTSIGVEIMTPPAKLAAVIYVDGSCDYRKRIGGWAALLYFKVGGHKVLSGGQRDTTNNQMEMEAVIQALRALDLKDDEYAIVKTDSDYVLRGAKHWRHAWSRGGWSAKMANADRWKEIHELLQAKDVRFEFVRGHSGDKWNDFCDRRASYERKRLTRGGKDVEATPDQGGRE